MRSFSIGSSIKLMALALTLMLLAACGGRGHKPDVVANADIPAGFDVTLVAAADSQFDYDGAPLTSEDLKSALRYRQEQSLPMATVLLKRAEKQKIKKEHLIALARIAYEMKFKAYTEEDGQISELRAQLKEPVAEPAKPDPSQKH